MKLPIGRPRKQAVSKELDYSDWGVRLVSLSGYAKK